MVPNDITGVAAKLHHSGLNGINGLMPFCKTAFCGRLAFNVLVERASLIFQSGKERHSIYE
jgi:hypothetical protein